MKCNWTRAIGITILVAFPPPAPATAQSSLTATLVANDTIRAEWFDFQTGIVGASHTHPAGPLTAAQLRAMYGSTTMARYDCNLTSGSGAIQFTAASECWLPVGNRHGRTHSDLLLTITGTGVASLAARLVHQGDLACPGAFRVDIGDDGSVELDVGTCGSPRHHRLWTWDFGSGDLAVRIRTDQQTSGGPQLHLLSLWVDTWAAGATPVAGGCGGLAMIRDPIFFACETMNYQLAADPPTQPGQWMSLRAYGYGDLGMLVASDSSSLTSVQLPGPYPGPCPALATSLLLLFPTPGASTMTQGNPPTPREWTFAVPVLPPGLRIYVQHGSVATFATFAFGTSNVIRLDT